MDSSLQAQFNYYMFSTGRRIVTLRRIRDVAEDTGDAHIVQHADVALAHDHKTRELDVKWRESQHGAAMAPRLGPLGELIDGAVAGIRDGALALTKGARDDDPIAALAGRFLQTAFPVGVAVTTNLPSIEELAAVEVLLDRLNGELAPMVRELGLHVHVQRLTSLVPEYREAIETTPEKLAFRTVDAARKRGQALLVEVAALIVGTYYMSEDPEHVDARAALLAPILEQQAIIAASFRARRAVRDVNPDTEVPEPLHPELAALPESVSDPAIPLA